MLPQNAPYWTLGLLLILSACGSQKDSKGLTGPKEMKSTSPKTKQAFDLNGDNRPDAWRHYIQKDGKKHLSYKSFDFNFDGRVDLARARGAQQRRPIAVERPARNAGRRRRR